MKILNLYAGIGGNRKYWDGEKHDITAVEYDEEIARVYKHNFPNDEVVVGDAHNYLEENYQDYDFIWASPPCPTHSRMNYLSNVQESKQVKYPDMKLWQEIIFLDNWFEGSYVVENVKIYYEPLIKPQESGRHFFWSNFTIPNVEGTEEVEDIRNQKLSLEEKEEIYGITTKGFDLTKTKRKKLLNNCVHPEIGKKIFNAKKSKQQSLEKVLK